MLRSRLCSGWAGGEWRVEKVTEKVTEKVNVTMVEQMGVEV
jgi:hypothetical protein